MIRYIFLKISLMNNNKVKDRTKLFETPLVIIYLGVENGVSSTRKID